MVELSGQIGIHGGVQNERTVRSGDFLKFLAAVLIACVIVGGGLLFADRISRLLGETMINVLIRIMVILLGAVAVETVLTGTFNAVDAH